MSVSYQDFLDFAEIHIIDNQKGTEIEFRNSISRAYYAVYLLAKEIAEKLPAPNGVNMTQSGSHEKVIAKFDKDPKSGRRTKRSKYPVKEFLKTQLSEIETFSLSFSFQT
jgi:uncharacterized protein (UPF0332 family)